MTRATDNPVTGTITASPAIDPSLQAALYGPIDLNDRDNWPRELLKRRWNFLSEYYYKQKVQAATVAGLPVPPRFDPEEKPTAKQKQKPVPMKEMVERRRRFLASVAADETPETEQVTGEDHDSDVEQEAEALDGEDPAWTPEREAEYTWLEQMYFMTHTVDALMRQKAETEEVDDPEPPSGTQHPDDYPIDAFGQYAPAIEDIARVVQVAPAMVGVALLGGLSPLVQPLANVSHKEHDEGLPTTVNVLCIAESGERKSSVLRAIMAPLLKGLRAADDKRVGMVTNDITVDGLLTGLIDGFPAQYILAPEAVTLLGSHALTEEARLRFFGTVSALYSGEALFRTRVKDHAFAEDRRLSLTLFGQQVVVKGFLGSELVMHQGTANRFLFCEPVSLRGLRMYADEELEDQPGYQALATRLEELAQAPWPISEATGGVAPRVLRLTPEAKEQWIAFYNQLERQIGKEGRYEHHAGYVSRFPEQVLRLAALLAVLDDTEVERIDEDTMERAIRLGQFHLWEAIKTFHKLASKKSEEL